MALTGLLQGFNNGYSMVDNHMKDKKADERYQAGVTRQEKRDKVLDERYQTGVTRQAEMDKMHKTTFENQQEDRKERKSQLAVKQGRETYKFNELQRKGRYDNVMQGIANAYSADKTGANIPQEKWLEWREQAKGTNAEVLFDTTKQEANNYLVEQLKTGFEGADDEAIKNATNKYLSSQINRHIEEGIEDKEGNPINGMEFSRWQDDGKGGLIAHVNVVKADGTVYEAPISEFRSADDDDPIRVYNAEKLFDHLIAENQLIGVLNKTGYLQKLNSPNLRDTKGGDKYAEIEINKYAAGIQGISEGEAWVQKLNKSADPAKHRVEAFKLANEKFTDLTGGPQWVIDTPNGVKLASKKDPNARPANQNDVESEANRILDFFYGNQQQVQQQQQPQPAQPVKTPPLDRLTEGKNTKFKNGQVWTIKNGQAVQIW